MTGNAKKWREVTDFANQGNNYIIFPVYKVQVQLRVKE